MSQTTKALKTIVSGEEYKDLVAAIEKADYEAICNHYTQISRLLEEAEKGILQTIQGLSRQNKDEECQKFKSAFALRTRTTLPQWHQLDLELKKQKIMEGTVFALGSKGDPLVKTPEGRIVIVTGATLKDGEKVRFRVVTEGEKTDFGRVFELTPKSLHSILTLDTREKIRSSLNSIREHINNRSQRQADDGLSELSGLLRELENIRELTARLQADEREKIISQILAFRRRLLEDAAAKQVLDFISREEDREIEESCHGDEQELARALSAPGLFRHEAHEKVKAEILSGEKPKGYSEVVDNLERNLDSMSSALELLEFKSEIEETYPAARKYLERIDRFFWNLSERVRQLVATLADDKVCNIEGIHSAIRNAFSDEILSSELRRVFRSPEEFFNLRAALVELKTRLGDTQSTVAETALRPYLRRRITRAFNRNT